MANLFATLISLVKKYVITLITIAMEKSMRAKGIYVINVGPSLKTFVMASTMIVMETQMRI